MPKGSLSVVIPVFNEAENIQPLIERLESAMQDWPGPVEILFVDDGSTDGTLGLLKEAQERDPRIRIARFRRNLGQTAAMAAGFRLAAGEAVVTLDGDLQNDPAEVPRLVAMLDDWDVVCGIRTRRQDSRWKRFSSRIANGFRNWVTDDEIVDTGCTLKASDVLVTFQHRIARRADERAGLQPAGSTPVGYVPRTDRLSILHSDAPAHRYDRHIQINRRDDQPIGYRWCRRFLRRRRIHNRRLCRHCGRCGRWRCLGKRRGGRRNRRLLRRWRLRCGCTALHV